jgi:RNA polymerase sigma-70 factor (ECF subfamily)
MADARLALEDSLVRRCVAGERLAWRALHRRYYPIAQAFLRRLGVGPAELEDACQDVFLRMFRALPAYRGEAELKTWMYKLCVTEANRIRRRARVTQALAHLLRFRTPGPATTGLELSEDSARRKVETALGRMNDGQRSVFVLYELEGLAGKQISEILSCPLATVWRRLHYARRTFRESLGLEGQDGGGR